MSERLRKFGRQVLIGDLAIMKDQAHLIDNVIEPEEAESDDEVDLA